MPNYKHVYLTASLCSIIKVVKYTEILLTLQYLPSGLTVTLITAGTSQHHIQCVMLHVRYYVH